jgi:hypothetical protein
MRVRRIAVLGLVCVLLLLRSAGLPQIQQPPPGGDDAARYGIVCDGVTDTTTAIQNALDTVPVGTRIKLPSGRCMTSASLTISRTVEMEGAGMWATELRQTNAALPVLVVGTANNVQLHGFTLAHHVTPVAGGDGLLFQNTGGVGSAKLTDLMAIANWRGMALGCVAYAWADHLNATANNSHGIEFVYTDPPCPVQWEISHSISQANRGAGWFGHNTATSNGIGPFLNDVGSFGNAFGGYVFQGSAGHPINDVYLHSVWSSQDDRAGIFLDTFGAGHQLTNPWIELTGAGALNLGWPPTLTTSTHTGHCVAITQSQLAGAVAIVGGTYWNCSWSGVALYAPYSSLVGGSSYGNGQSLDADLAKRAGVAIGASGVQVSGHSFTLPGTTTLHYIHLAGVINDLVIGTNAYDPGLSVANFVSNEASMPGARAPTMVAGLAVGSNTAASAGLALYDASNGANPLKLLRVSLGYLQILNAAGSAAIHNLSDAGTPAWPARKGQAIVTDTNTFVHVALTPVEPDAAYNVQVTPVSSAGVPPLAAYTIVGVNKDVAGFDIVLGSQPGAGRSVTFDWFVHR